MITRSSRIAFALFFFAAVRAFAGPPTAQEVRKQVLPALLMGEISDIHMAGLDVPDTDEAEILDLAATDLAPWGEPGCHQIAFRMYWTATEDVYAQWIGEVPDGEVWLVRCGRAGRSYAEKWEEITVERKTENGETGFAVKRKNGKGKVEWDIATGLSSVATRSCWEAQAAVTGETLKFFDSPAGLPVR